LAGRTLWLRAWFLYPRSAGGWQLDTASALAANEKLIARVQDLEYSARWQDVLVDEELIYAFYDQQPPADVCSGASCEAWYKVRSADNRAAAAALTQIEPMRQ
jgi:ATP-dependent helicase HrpA